MNDSLRKNKLSVLIDGLLTRRMAIAMTLATGTVLVASGPAFAQAAGQGAQTEEWVPGRLLVQPRPGLSDEELDKILKPVGARAVGRINGIDVRIVELPAQASEKAVAALLRNNKHLQSVELDMKVPAEGSNDPYFTKQWHLPKIGADAAWSLRNGTGITVAILDSGVDGNHPDLAPLLVSGWNFYDNNSNSADVQGHGTAVAGTAVAATNNSVGIAGVAGGARIMPIRVTDTTGYAYWSTLASGITWAADRGARVANASFAAGGSSTVQSAAQYMRNKGGVVTISAGNSGTLLSTAASSSVIVVSATTSTDVKASWSDYGNFVDISAPGSSIYTTNRGSGYGAWSGTSFSSPVVAGVAALVMSANPRLTASDVEQILFSTAADLGTAGKDTSYGYGRVNALKAVEVALNSAATDTTAPAVALSSPTGGTTVKGLVAVDVAASDNVGVSRVDLHVNGVKLASATTKPYGFSWDSTKVANGTATLTAYAFDAAGNSSSNSVSVKVDNTTASPTPEPTSDSTAPKASISNPTSGSTVNGNVNVAASATDNVGVARMRLYLDGTLVASANGSSVGYTWTARTAKSGSHIVKVEAVDAAGNVGTASVTVKKK